ncbi:MAG: DUF4292 domain-containing protein [Flavobacteriales bacterium]|nr:DUF4292 domain-containing protein [Flavobacteriales bacterium]
MRPVGISGLLLGLALFSAGCKSSKPIPIIKPELPARSAEKLTERLLHPHLDTLRYYSAKASVELELPDGNKSFKAHIRSTRDSAAWVSVVPALGIEVARVLLTPDSLKLLDKLHDRYFIGDTMAARARFGLQPSLALFQQALLGLPVGLDPKEKYRSDREDGHYILTSKEKRRFIRAAEDISPGDTLSKDKDMTDRRLERTLRQAEEKEAIVLRYWIEPDSFQVTRVQIADLIRDQTADVRYEQRGGVEELFLPTRISITLSEPDRQARGILELSRIQLEGPLPMNFRVPEKYEPMP